MKYLQVSLEKMMIDYKDVINHIATLPSLTEETGSDSLVRSLWENDLQSMLRELTHNQIHRNNPKAQELLRKIEQFLKSSRAKRRAEDLRRENVEFYRNARLNYYLDNLMLHADSVHKKEEY